MASSQDYLEYVLELLKDVPNVSCKKMMGEYLLYADNFLFGGIYDNCFLIKKTSSLEVRGFKEIIPYPGAKMMYLVDIENPIEVAHLIVQVLDDLKCI